MPSLDLSRAVALAHAGREVAEVSHLGAGRWRRPVAPVSGLQFRSRLVTTIDPWVGGSGGGALDLGPLNLEGGDLLICVVCNATNTNRPHTFPDGWTRHLPHVFANSSQDSNIDVLSKTMGADPDESLLLTTTVSGALVYHFYAFSGHDPLDPIASITGHTATNTRVSNPPAITPPRPSSIIVGASMAAYSSAEGMYDIEVAGQDVMMGNRDGGYYSASSTSWYLPWASGTYDQPAVSIPGSVAGNSGASLVFAVNPAG